MKPEYSIITVLFLSLGLFSGTVSAGGTNASLHGRVISVPCYINNKNALDFDFQRVGTKRVDGVRYAVTQNVPVKCDQDVPAKVFLKVRSTETSATKSNVLKTNVDNLGIALYGGNQDTNSELALNTEIEIDTTQMFQIKAVPVKEDASKPLEAKPFTVTATVVAYYE